MFVIFMNNTIRARGFQMVRVGSCKVIGELRVSSWEVESVGR